MRSLDLSWSEIVAVAATAVLAFLGVIGNPDQPLVWVIAGVCAIVVIIVAILRLRKQGIVRDKYEELSGSILRLIADLANLTGRRFDLWVVDLYLPKTSLYAHRRVWGRSLRRSLSIALTDFRTVPGEFSLEHAVFGRCFTEGHPKLWWNAQLVSSAEENEWDGLGGADNDDLQSWCGVASANPVLSRIGTSCRGVLVIHTKSDAEIVTTVLGALRETEGRRLVTAACHQIHSLL